MSENKGSLSLDINLIAAKKNQFQKVLEWLTTYGLIITAITTVVVVGLSWYKLSLQNQLASLNQEISSLADQISAQSVFEDEFLLTQEKLSLYQELSQSEKMEDLFPKLSSLIPEGVQVTDLVIQPNQVEMVCFVTNQQSLTQFVNNLNLVNAQTFADGQQLLISNTTAKEIVKNSNSSRIGDGYDFSLSFNYTIQ